MTPGKILLVLALLLAACGGPGTEAPSSDGFDPDESPVAGFDFELVQMAILAECEVEPVLFDGEICGQIDAERLTAEGMTLRVPTSLEPADTQRASEICDQIAEMRFSGEANEDVGFDTLEVLDSGGAVAAQCAAAF